MTQCLRRDCSHRLEPHPPPHLARVLGSRWYSQKFLPSIQGAFAISDTTQRRHRPPISLNTSNTPTVSPFVSTTAYQLDSYSTHSVLPNQNLQTTMSFKTGLELILTSSICQKGWSPHGATLDKTSDHGVPDEAALTVGVTPTLLSNFLYRACSMILTDICKTFNGQSE